MKGEGLRVRACLTAMIVLVTAAVVAAAEDAAPAFRLYLEQPGIYRVSHAELVGAGLDAEPRPSAGIGVRNLDLPVPVWIADGGDGTFGPGDWVEFVGERLRGTVSFLDEYSRFNCYVLRFDDPAPERFAARQESAVVPEDFDDFAELEAWFHIEHDLLRLRFSGNAGEEQEVWYWYKVTHMDVRPFRQVVQLDDLDRSSPSDVQARFNFRAWSKPRKKADKSQPDHEVEVLLDEEPRGGDSWNGKDPHTFSVSIPAGDFARESTVRLRATKRTIDPDGELLIDVNMLNWIEMRYPRTQIVDSGQARFVVAGSEHGRPLRLSSATGAPLRVYTSDGHRITHVDGSAPMDFEPTAEDATYFASDAEHLMEVDAVVLDRPSSLRSPEQQADYVMIAHRTLMEAVEPLAEFHRSRGLAVRVVDVQDIYDEFNHGIVHPRALRGFLGHAYHQWKPPAVRFALLVGDASWDFKNPTADDRNYADWTYRSGERGKFVKNDSTPYSDGAKANNRNLVPTWNYSTYQGYAASDTRFVCVDGDDLMPELAIGRLPVVEPDEVTAIVDKTIAYASDPEVGPWRRTVMFVANENSAFQGRSDEAASALAERGWAPLRIYPDPKTETNERHSQQILESFDDGLQMVHFIGHGGRYIWRTGPPDLKFNHDLFTLEHLDQLEPNRRLPIVLSLTCYSGPFDHPSADSIGEKFLRVPGRGAVAVVAASWRNSPSKIMGSALLRELSQPGATIGEGVLRAKLETRNTNLIQMYNLLGDPAAPVSVPQHQLELVASDDDGILVVSGSGAFSSPAGEVLVEWLDSDSAVAHSQTVAANGASFTASVAPSELPADVEVVGVRAYLWDVDARTDAVGMAVLGTTSPAPVEQAAQLHVSEPAGQVEGGNQTNEEIHP